MALSNLPVPPSVLVGLLLGGLGVLCGASARVLARTDGQRTLVRRAGLLACAAALLSLLLASWTTGPVPAEIAGWLAWPAAPALLAAGLAALLPRTRSPRASARA